MSLRGALRDRIAHAGPLSVADYMQACLLDARYGYYMTRDPFGKGGDFTTAPEISQIFGELLGAWLAGAWLASGSPRAVLAELGPGRGTLMRDALRATRHVPGFHEALNVILVEASPVLSAVQKRTLEGAHARIGWEHALERLPALPLFFVANEFFDALPVRQFVGEEERRVAWQDDGFAFVPEGAVTRETCADGEAVMGLLARHIARHGGAGLTVDYGYAACEQGDTLQAVKDHAFVDVLACPGEADLTAHVDFSALAKVAEAHGATVLGPVAQGVFLARLGAELRAAQLCRNATPLQTADIMSGLQRLLLPAGMGELFKVLGLCHSEVDYAEGFQ